MFRPAALAACILALFSCGSAAAAPRARSAPPYAEGYERLAEGEAGRAPVPARAATPAAALAESLHAFDVTHYRLDLDFPCTGTALSGACTVSLTARAALGSVALDFLVLHADSAYQDGAVAAFATNGTQFVVTLPRPLAPGDSTALRLVYHGPAYLGYVSSGPDTWFTFSEPSSARYWYPCFDQPWDKAASSEIHATVPDTMFVASNGLQLQPPTVDAVRHRKTYHWTNAHPIATYLVSVAIGHYAELRDTADYVPLRSYVLRADSLKAVNDFENLPDMVNFFGSLWGQFPFEKYGMAATANFGGGMEHQTETTIARYWLTGTRQYEWAIAHELGHQWWGDMVTCFTWADIWVNEGFASYADILYTEHAYGAAQEASRLAAWAEAYFVEDSSQSYALYNPPSNHTFGLTIYYKGAWVLHMLRHVMGDSSFVRGWRDYGVAHRYGNGSVADFQAAMEARYGGSLSWFFDPWVRGRSYPVYRVSYGTAARAAGGFYGSIQLEQLQPPGVPLFAVPVDLLLHTAAGDTLVTVWPQSAKLVTQFVLRGQLQGAALDPGGWLLHKEVPGGAISDVPGGLLPRRARITRVRTAGGAVELAFELPDSPGGVRARLELLDVLGRRVAVPWSGPAEAGAHTARWKGEGPRGGRAPSGIYFARLTCGVQTDRARVFWLR